MICVIFPTRRCLFHACIDHVHTALSPDTVLFSAGVRLPFDLHTPSISTFVPRQLFEYFSHLPLSPCNRIHSYTNWRNYNITKTLTKSERDPSKVCHYDSYLLVLTLNFNPLTLKCHHLTILHLCMKYEKCVSKPTDVIVSEPKWWQS